MVCCSMKLGNFACMQNLFVTASAELQLFLVKLWIFAQSL